MRFNSSDYCGNRTASLASKIAPILLSAITDVIIQSVQRAVVTLQRQSRTVAESLSAVRFLAKNAAGFDLGVDSKWERTQCFPAVIERFYQCLVH